MIPRLFTWLTTPAIAAVLVLVVWATTLLPERGAALVRFYILMLMLSWVIRRVLTDGDRLREHRREIQDTLNHRLQDFARLKTTADVLEDRVEAVADRLAQKTAVIAEGVATQAQQIADLAAEESKKRHEKLDERLTEVLKGQEALIKNGHDTKPVIDETNVIAHEIADTVGAEKKEKP